MSALPQYFMYIFALSSIDCKLDIFDIHVYYIYVHATDVIF